MTASKLLRRALDPVETLATALALARGEGDPGGGHQSAVMSACDVVDGARSGIEVP